MSEKDAPLWWYGSRKTSFGNHCYSAFRKYESRVTTVKYVIIMRFSNYSSRSLRTGKRQRRHLLCRGFAAFELWSSGLLQNCCGSWLPKSRRDCYRHVKVKGECAACTFLRSRWGRDFPPVQTGPVAHSASCTMGTGFFPGVKCGRGVLLTTHSLLVPRSWKSRAIPLPTLWNTPGL